MRPTKEAEPNVCVWGGCVWGRMCVWGEMCGRRCGGCVCGGMWVCVKDKCDLCDVSEAVQ